MRSGHFVDQRIKPVDEQQLIIGSLTVHRNRLLLNHPSRIGDHRRHGQSCTFKCGLLRPADPSNAHIGLVREVLPARVIVLGLDRSAISSPGTDRSATDVRETVSARRQAVVHGQLQS